MKTRPEIEVEIVRLHHAEGWPPWTIAENVGVHASVVTRVFGQAGVVPAVTMPRPSKVDPYLPSSPTPTTSPACSTVLALRRHHRGPILRASSSCSPADRGRGSTTQDITQAAEFEDAHAPAALAADGDVDGKDPREEARPREAARPRRRGTRPAQRRRAPRAPRP